MESLWVSANFPQKRHYGEWQEVSAIGEAKRRKEKGLPPRPKKEEKKPDTPNIFVKYQILPYILISGFIIFLIYDVIKYYSVG